MKDMVYSFKKYFRIFLQMQKFNLMKRMAYPFSFFGISITVLLVMFLSVLFINVNFSYIDSVSGWNIDQMYAVLGSFMVAEGVLWAFFGQLNAINSLIRDGGVDGILLKPVDSQFMISLWRGDVEDLVRIITGFSLIIFSMKNTIGFEVFHFILFLLLLFNGIVMLYSFNLAVRSVSFWIIDGSGLWLLMERITGNSQYPTDIYYHKVVRGIFTFIIPLAFVATVPAKILTNVSIDFKLVALSFVMAILFFVFSRKFWKFSLGRYSSASS